MAPGSADSTYNNGREPLYPTGLAISSDGRELYVANNLGDSLGIVRGPDAPRPELRVHQPATAAARRRQFVYPYDVRVIRGGDGRDKVYVSCWNDAAVVVVDPRRGRADRAHRRGLAPERDAGHGRWLAPVRCEREYRHRVGHRHEGRSRARAHRRRSRRRHRGLAAALRRWL